MSALKLHVFRTQMGDDGTENCDYRGEGELGAGDNDQHRTVTEVDPVPDELASYIEEHGPALNKVFAGFAEHAPDFAGPIATLLGLEGDGPISLRIGLWDK